MDEEVTPRFDQKVEVSTAESGKLTIRMVDRINVDDVLLHLVNRELFRIITGKDTGAEVEPTFKQFLLQDRFTAGQG